MVVHILCTECSEDLAEVYPFYVSVKNAYFKSLMSESKKPIDINKIDFKSDVLPDLGFVFEALDIKNMCCRMHILANTNFEIL
jgi:DNA-directed RNA polymerase subunit N (RpoN/RPB10)